MSKSKLNEKRDKKKKEFREDMKKLDFMNNKIEDYFGNTLPKRIKNIFRTKRGLFNFISNRKKGWVENNV